MNLLKERVAAGPTDKSSPIVVDFQPWLVGEKQFLIQHFFKAVDNAVGQISRRDLPFWKPRRWRIWWLRVRVRTRLASLSRSLSGAGLLKALSVPEVLAIFALIIARIFTRKPTLEDQKRRIDKLLGHLIKSTSTAQIIVFIDDMDRLEPDEALEMLRLVKAIADFPAITYVLIYDREILAEAIVRAARVSDGNAYLEKIVQRSVALPVPSPFDLRMLLKKRLMQSFPNDADWMGTRASHVLDVWAGRLVQTPRDAVKVAESVLIRWPSLKGKADLLDLIWLELLREKATVGETDMYGWVVDYVRSLQALAQGGSVSRKEEKQEELVSILSALGWRKRKNDSIFPDNIHGLDSLLQGVRHSTLDFTSEDEMWIFREGDLTTQQAIAEKRLSSPWHWSLYSRFEQPKEALPDSVWSALEETARDQPNSLSAALKMALDIANAQNVRSNFGDQILERVQRICESAPLEVRHAWLFAVVNTADMLYSLSANSGFWGGRLTDRFIERVFRLSFVDIADSQRTELLEELFVQGASLWALGEIFRSQYFSHQEDAGHRGEPVVSPKELALISDIISKRLTDIRPVDLSQAASAWTILYSMLNALDETQAKKWFSGLIKTDADLVETLTSLETVKSSAQRSAGVPNSWVTTFADPEHLLKRLGAIKDQSGDLGIRAEKLIDRWYHDRGER
jgi:hypothetical protein